MFSTVQSISQILQRKEMRSRENKELSKLSKLENLITSMQVSYLLNGMTVLKGSFYTWNSILFFTWQDKQAPDWDDAKYLFCTRQQALQFEDSTAPKSFIASWAWCLRMFKFMTFALIQPCIGCISNVQDMSCWLRCFLFLLLYHQQKANYTQVSQANTIIKEEVSWSYVWGVNVEQKKWDSEST
jgi:hypothetical protein